MKLRNIVFLILIVVVSGSCSRSSHSDLEFYLYGTYTNTDGSNPFFEVNSIQTDSEVYFDGIMEYGGTAPDVELIMNNLSIFSDMENYYIDAVEVEEEVNGKWTWYPEFDVSYGNLTQIGVVLVLDVSSSLGEDFDDVLEYATEFVELIFENAPEAQVGVVSFSTTIDVFQPSSNMESVRSYIYNLSMEEYTKMYDAMAEGINRLRLLTVDGRALVTFTDGRDNLSNAIPSQLIDEMSESGIRSYTMGLQGKGGVNEEELRELAVNGNYRFTSSKNDLRNTFQFFAESVSNVYQVIYKRNNQIIGNPRKLRYKFIDRD